jgi:hypothetical protein
MRATTDRGDIIHFAGRHRLSPALRDGAPALVAHGDPGERCGWARFFAVLRERRLAAAFDPDDAGSLRLVPEADARGPARRGRRALEEARRFLDALRGKPPPHG